MQTKTKGKLLYLNEITDTETKQQKLESLKQYDYVIDKATNKVKNNDKYGFIIGIDENSDYKDDEIMKTLENEYISQMESFLKYLKRYDNKIYTTQKMLDNDILNFNKYYDKNYLNGFNLRVRDLLDEQVKTDYIRQNANAITMVQMQTLQKAGTEIFLRNDIGYGDYEKIVTDKELKATQTQTIARIKDPDKRQRDPIKDFLKDFSKSDLDFIVMDTLFKQVINTKEQEINKKILEKQYFYNQVHLLYDAIDKKIIEIVSKFEIALNSLTTLEKNATAIKPYEDTSTIYKRIKPASNIVYDFDIMQLFNNIYPNYKYKSIGDNRHQNIDVKAELMFDLDPNNIENLEDLRLIEFIKNGNIWLYPIQEGIIDGFITIRDIQGTDSPIPLLSALKHTSANKKLKLPTSKKDLRLYEDFMLFFNKCKIKIKIIDRTTNDIVFEVFKPIPLLANTPAQKSGRYCYIIGNSILNILKNELDELKENPKRTSITKNKATKYLTGKQPTTAPVLNMKNTILPKILQMFNSYKKRASYPSKINIIKLYDFQAMYNKHPRPTKDDRYAVRDMLNKYLNELINKEMIEEYTFIKGKNDKDYTHVKIKINKGFKI